MRRKVKDDEKRLKYSYYINRKTGCWEGIGNVNSSGYLRITIDGVLKYLHVAMYEKYYGTIPRGMIIDHLCKNKRCCNIFHLKITTREKNVSIGKQTKLSYDDVEKIKLECLKKHQTQVAREFGINPSYVSQIVNGNRRKCRY